MNRRAFLAALTATTAGLLIPERTVWALDRTMLAPPDTKTMLTLREYAEIRSIVTGDREVDDTYYWLSIYLDGKNYPVSRLPF